MFTKFKSKQLQQRGLFVTTIIIAGLAGAHLVNPSFAYTNDNPYGWADSCALSGNTTVIYGWANDPQAPIGTTPKVIVTVGAKSSTVNTSVTGYRDSYINAYIKKYHADQPTTGEYGYVAKFTGLYKGSSYAISGTTINVGSGSNVAIHINDSKTVDNRPFFANNKIPDACLATAPVATPNPVPTPIPTPTPIPAPVTTAPVTTPAKTTAPVTSPAAASPAASAADAKVTTGTSSAVISVPADGASQVHVTYGTSDGALQNSPDQAVSGDNTIITLTALTPLSSYNYQLVRTAANGTAATSIAASFKTQGYRISLEIVDTKHKAVAGIKATINDAGKSKATSNKKGVLTFSNLPAAVYNVSFNYGGKTISQKFDTTSMASSTQVTDDGSPRIITLSNTVTVSATIAVSTPSVKAKPAASSKADYWMLLLVVVFVGTGLFVFIRKRRRAATLLNNFDSIDKHSHAYFKKHAPEPAAPPPKDIGKSLAKLVMEDMREEAARRKNQN